MAIRVILGKIGQACIILLFLSIFTLYTQTYTLHGCTKSGNGILSLGECFVESMNAQIGGKMSGEFCAEGGPLIMGILHEINYTEGEPINSTKCVVYEFDIEGTFECDILHDGNWYFILRNPCRSDVHYEYTWSVRSAIDQIIVLLCWISIPSFILSIVMVAILLKRRKA